MNSHQQYHAGTVLPYLPQVQFHYALPSTAQETLILHRGRLNALCICIRSRRRDSILQVDGESAPSQYTIDIGGGSHGQLAAGHLADHPSAVAALQGAVKVGTPLGPLLVLERVEVRLCCLLALCTCLLSSGSFCCKCRHALLFLDSS